MTTISIPKELVMDKNLVAVPRDVYAEFLAWQRLTKAQREISLTKAQREVLAQARRRLKAKKYLSLNDLAHGLGIAY